MDDCNMTAIDASLGGLSDEAPVKLLKRAVLRGCNIHDQNSVMVQAIDLGSLSGRASSQAGPGFVAAFLDRFRPLRTKIPGSDITPLFLERLQAPSGQPFEAMLLEAIVAIETALAFEMGHLAPIAFARVEACTKPGEVQLIWSCNRTRMSRRAAEIAVIGLLDLLPENLYPHCDAEAESFEDAFDDLKAYARKRRMAPTTAALMLAAKQREIPCEAIGGPRLRIGQGVNQRHLFASVTSGTSFWACRLSGDKRYTNRRLAELGLPVPKQIKVADVAEAETAADELGFPLVIKPLKGKKGSAVSAGIRERSHLLEAFALAFQAGSGVVAEQFVQGDDHRLLVIDGRFVAATRRKPPTVEGDGRRTIEDLVRELNDDPGRDDFRMMKVAIDATLEAFLTKNGYWLGEVLGPGKVIPLRSTANGSTGGVFSDVTDIVHPDNQALAIRAAQAVELDVAGVDFITSDISLSYKDVGGHIVEINSRPGLRPHTWPSHGQPRDVAGAMLDFTLRPSLDGRIPTLLVAGDRGTGPVARALDVILRGADRSAGLIMRQGAFLNGGAIRLDKKRQNRAASVLLRDPNLEILVSTVSLRESVKRGLTFDRCHVAAIVNREIEGDVDMFRKGLDVVAKASGKLVVGAGNSLALQALGDIEPSRLILVSPRLRGSVIERHLSAGGPAVIKLWNAERERIVLYDDDKVVTAIAVDPTITRRGSRAQERKIEARMFAVALAYGAGLTGPEIDAALANAPKPVPRPKAPTSELGPAALGRGVQC